MLFSYSYVRHHKMGKLHGFINYIFYRVWCRAKDIEEYSLEIFKGSPELYRIMEELFRLNLAGKISPKKNKAAYFFYSNVNVIFNQFAQLSQADIQQYKGYYLANNNIKQLCEGSQKYQPVTYSLLNKNKADLNKNLEIFFKNIYSSGFLELARTVSVVGTLGEYYNVFIKQHRIVSPSNYCPFCGLSLMKSEFVQQREAYDHYLPKSKYPFISVKLQNLVPACNNCNSVYKRDQDPLYHKGNRRKAFYPYSDVNHLIKLSIKLDTHCNISKLLPNDISINFFSPYVEETNTWQQLFSIDIRYKEQCCLKYHSWLNRIFVESQNYEKSPDEILNHEINLAKKAPWDEANFLKKAFLQAYAKAELLKQYTQTINSINKTSFLAFTNKANKLKNNEDIH